MHHDGGAAGRRATDGVVAEAERGAVPRLKPLDRGQGAEIDRAAGGRDRWQLRRARQRRGDQPRDQQSDHADAAKGPFQKAQGATKHRF